MYATVRRYTAKKGAAQSLRAELEKTFLPVVRSIKGFANYYYISGGEEHGRDVLLTVTVCQTQEGVDESVRKAAEWVKAHARDADVSPPMVTTGEVYAKA